MLAASAAAQFIPEKPAVIHPALESRPDRTGDVRERGAGLGLTVPPAPAAPRPAGGGGARRPAPPVSAPPRPAIPGAAAASEQKAQGTRPPIESGVSFDGLGDGFVSKTVAGAGARGGIDISLALG